MSAAPVHHPLASGALRMLERTLFALLLVMLAIVFLNVVARFVFHSAITWADEVARFMFVWLTFLGATLGVARGAHIGMDLVLQRVGPRTRRVFEAVSCVLVLAFLSVWGFFGWSLVVQNLDYRAPSTGVPMAYVYAVGPLSALLMAAIYLARLVRILRAATRA